MTNEQIEVRRERARLWNKNNRERMKANQRAWAEKNPDKVAANKANNPIPAETNRARIQEWRQAYPWYDSWQGARQRCTNPKVPRWPRYGGRGILFKLSKEDMAFIWDRDGGSLQSQPSIDRIDNDGHYELSNCRIIERSENSKRRRLPPKT